MDLQPRNYTAENVFSFIVPFETELHRYFMLYALQKKVLIPANVAGHNICFA